MSPLHPTNRETFLKAIFIFSLVILAFHLLLVVPLSAQTAAETNKNNGNILGTVRDVNNDPVLNATVTLQGPGTGDHRTVVTKDDGTFTFQDVRPGIAYQISVTADGFAQWNSSVTLEPGQNKTISTVTLRVETVKRAVTVGYSPTEVATEQLKVEEEQRVLKFIPNLYVTYEPHPEPLTTRMKFQLAYKSLTTPVLWAWWGIWSGIQQAADIPNYPLGTEGYGKRYWANAATGVSSGLIGNAILPSLLHQDPRYYYQGKSAKGRLGHALSAAFVCPGDNGHLQPNYSTLGGGLIASGISAAYLPRSDRTYGHVFGDFAIGMGTHVFAGVAQEFILAKFTSKGNKSKK